MLSSCSNACPAIGNTLFFAGLLSASLVSSADDSDSAFGVDSRMTRLDLSGADTAKAQVRWSHTKGCLNFLMNGIALLKITHVLYYLVMGKIVYLVFITDGLLILWTYSVVPFSSCNWRHCFSRIFSAVMWACLFFFSLVRLIWKWLWGFFTAGLHNQCLKWYYK